VSRSTYRPCGSLCRNFNTEETGRTTEGTKKARIALRAKRIRFVSVISVVLPVSSVLKAERHCHRTISAARGTFIRHQLPRRGRGLDTVAALADAPDEALGGLVPAESETAIRRAQNLPSFALPATGLITPPWIKPVWRGIRPHPASQKCQSSMTRLEAGRLRNGGCEGNSTIKINQISIPFC
jgi:hypothetical protein